MNKTIETSIRDDIKNMLTECTEPQQMVFKRMYSHNDLSLDINKVVDNIPIDRLDWAFSQVERTINKNK